MTNPYDLEVRTINWSTGHGDCTMSLTATVTFNRPYWSQPHGKYFIQKTFHYGKSRGLLKVGITAEEFEEQAMKIIELELHAFLRDYHEPAKDE